MTSLELRRVRTKTGKTKKLGRKKKKTISRVKNINYLILHLLYIHKETSVKLNRVKFWPVQCRGQNNGLTNIYPLLALFWSQPAPEGNIFPILLVFLVLSWESGIFKALLRKTAACWWNKTVKAARVNLNSSWGHTATQTWYKAPYSWGRPTWLLWSVHHRKTATYLQCFLIVKQCCDDKYWLQQR